MMKQKSGTHHSNQSGAIFVLFAVTFLFLMAFSAIAIDMGTVYVQKERLQNAADAAALAGAAQLKETITDNTIATITNSYVEPYTQKNLGNLTVNPKKSVISPDTPDRTFSSSPSIVNVVAIYYKVDATDPTSAQKLAVELRQNVPLYFMHYFGFATMPVAVTATAQYATSSSSSGSGSGSGGESVSVNPFKYTFCASESLTFINAKSKVHGSIRVPTGKLSGYTNFNQLDNKSPDYGSSDISLEDNSSVNNFLNTSPKPDNVFIASGDMVVNISTSGNKDYVKLTTNGNTTTYTLSKNTPVIIVSLKGNITFTSSKNNASVILYAPNGNLAINTTNNTSLSGSFVGKNITVDDSSAGNTNNYFSKSINDAFTNNKTTTTTTTGSASLIQ